MIVNRIKWMRIKEIIDIKGYMIYKKKNYLKNGLKFRALSQSNFLDKNQVIHAVTWPNKELDSVIFFNGRDHWLQWSMLTTSNLSFKILSHMCITRFKDQEYRSPINWFPCSLTGFYKSIFQVFYSIFHVFHWTHR